MEDADCATSMRLAHAQDGITGIETAILLLAVVVVASVFAMGLIRTGALSAETSGRVASGGVDDSLSALFPLGDVVGITDPTDTRLDKRSSCGLPRPEPGPAG